MEIRTDGAQPINLDDLPLHTPWVARLLASGESKKAKTEEQILREYSVDKWGALLNRWKDNPCDLDVVREWECSPDLMCACSVHQDLVLMRKKGAHETHVALIERVLADSPSRHLVEIGCGYGSVLLEIARRGHVQYDSISGIEYTAEGAVLAAGLAKRHGLTVNIGKGDFASPGISDLAIPPDADIFTSFSFAYVSDSRNALRNLIAVAPRRVLHFEPIFQHCPETTTLGLLQRRYMDLNDYNSTLLPELKQLEVDGEVELLHEEPVVFGGNCLLPASVVAWRPARKR